MRKLPLWWGTGWNSPPWITARELWTPSCPGKTSLPGLPWPTSTSWSSSAHRPSPTTDPYLIDRIASIAVLKGCRVLLCLNKCDLDPAQEL